MGFKRTNEGRVFFQGTSDNDENQSYGFAKGPKADSLRKNIQAQSGATQSQIITLLKTLNEKLKVTQAERSAMRKELDAYRRVIENLEQKSERSERAYLSLEQKVSSGSGSVDDEIISETLQELEDTRKLVFDLEDRTKRADKSVIELKKEIEDTKIQTGAIGQELTKRVKDSEERQEALDAKVEDAVAQQAKMVRKIDKAIEDRARFMRKIERIEETVLQTRDSLNAKAMVLLTDQGVAGEHAQAMPQDMSMEGLESRLDAHLQEQAEIAAAEAQPWWKSSAVQGAGLVGLIVLALAGGLYIGDLQKTEAISFESFEPAAGSQVTADVDFQTPPPQSNNVDVSAMDWTIQTDTSEFSESAPAQKQEASAAIGNDIGTVDLNNQEQVERLLEENPNAVAAALNEIEPSKQTPQEAPVEQAPVQNNAPTANPTPVAELAKLMSPDRRLEGVMKDIETQAFAGVPEAQHDLAAVYTAGHGGVSQDYERAAFWFEQAANGGVANAAYNLGVLHHQGLGMKADMKNAIDWYTRAGDLGHPEAQYNLGIAYIEGIGVPYDPQRATKYFKNAAQNEIMEASYNLGLIYENGLLGEAKPDEALMWYKIAADKGSPEAQQALQQLAESLDISIEDVNTLAESMKALNQSSNTAAPQQAATRAAAPAPAQPQAQISESTDFGTQALTAQIQEYLMNAGLYPGPADGITGPLTTDAIRAYQKKNEIAADGQISEGLLTHMLSNEELSQGSRAE